MTPPEAPLALPPGGNASGPAEPVPRRLLGCTLSLLVRPNRHFGVVQS
jgi:hypothetical protein